MTGSTAFPSLPAAGDRSLVRTHARWVVGVALLTMVSALLVVGLVQRPTYQTEAKVLVGARVPAAGAALAPDMETEVQVVTSGVVLSTAAAEAGASPSYLRKRLSVTVPADSTVLRLRFADRTPDETQRRAAAIAEAYLTYRAGQASLLSPATAPRTATRPDFLLAGLAGLAVGLLVGVGSAFVRDRRDDRLRGPLDLQSVTGLPVLTRVPPCRDEESTLVVPAQSPHAEPYRYLRTKVLKHAWGPVRTDVASSGPVVVTVSSASRDDGAARAAANLAAALARAGHRVVLLGRYPGDHLGGLPTVGPDAGPGLTTVSRGQLPADLTDVESLRWHLDQLPPDVAVVVVLAPPVLASAESLLWTDVAHEVVLVATVGQSARRHLADATAELAGARGHLLGAVLFDAPQPEPRTELPKDAPVSATESAAASAPIPSEPVRHDGVTSVDTPHYARPGS